MEDRGVAKEMNIFIIFVLFCLSLSMIYGENILETQENLRISQGRVAQLGKIPYISLIHAINSTTSKSEPICAGVILSETCILSSAYCAYYCARIWECKLFVGRVSVWSGGEEVAVNDIKWHNTFDAIIPDL